MSIYQNIEVNDNFKKKLLTSSLSTSNDLKKEQILVVDDTSANLKTACDFLTEHGFEVLTAKSGTQALKFLEKASPDLILLDVLMPDMDGFETCRRLKTWEKTQDIPIIFMTAIADLANPENKVKGLTLGAVDYISKPIQLEEVLARVKTHLHLRSLTQQLQAQNIRLQQEIYHRQQAEAAIAQSECKYRELVETCQDIIWSVDDRGYFTFVNPVVQQILGYEPDEMLDRPFTDFAAPEQVATDREGLQYVLNGNSVFGYEAKYLAQDGRAVYLLRNTIPKRDSEGRVIGATGTATDISDRKQAEEALRLSEVREREKAKQLAQTLTKLKRTQAQLIHAEKMSSLGQMVAGVAHEINNPVSFIYGNLAPTREYFQELTSLIELYQHTYPSPTPEIQTKLEEIEFDFRVEDWRKLINSLEVGAERIAQIVQSLKLFCRLDEAELKPINIHDGIENSLLILQHRLRTQGERPEIQVIKHYAQLPLVACYASQLNQVFMNLLNNAIDALETRPSPRLITISTSIVTKESSIPNSQVVVIQIADNGTGISEEVSKHMFDPFFTTKSVGKGTGLGLAISHQIIVEKHKGQISCVSTPGQGTELIVEIPLRQA